MFLFDSPENISGETFEKFSGNQKGKIGKKMVKHISQFIKEGPIFVEILLNSLYTDDVNAGKAKKICRPWF